MQTRKIKENNKKKSWLIIIGSLIIIIGIAVVSFDIISPYLKEKEENKALEQFYIKEETIEDKIDKTTSEEVKEETKTNKFEFVAVLKIPKINLEKGIVGRNSKFNSIDYGNC